MLNGVWEYGLLYLCLVGQINPLSSSHHTKTNTRLSWLFHGPESNWVGTFPPSQAITTSSFTYTTCIPSSLQYAASKSSNLHSSQDWRGIFKALVLGGRWMWTPPNTWLHPQPNDTQRNTIRTTIKHSNFNRHFFHLLQLLRLLQQHRQIHIHGQDGKIIMV